MGTFYYIYIIQNKSFKLEFQINFYTTVIERVDRIQWMILRHNIYFLKMYWTRR